MGEQRDVIRRYSLTLSDFVASYYIPTVLCFLTVLTEVKVIPQKQQQQQQQQIYKYYHWLKELHLFSHYSWDFTHPSFKYPCQHDYGRDIPFPNHTPEIFNGILSGT